MEVSEDRGIECQGVCFNLVDGKIVLAVYQDLPGIKRNLAGTTFLRSFTIDDWLAVNRYLRDMVGDVDDMDVEKEEEEEEVIPFRPIGVPSMTSEEGNDGQE